jgi:hypothetical protein
LEDFSTGTVRFIGVMELLAATGLTVLMLLAMLTHNRRRDRGAIVFTAVLMQGRRRGRKPVRPLLVLNRRNRRTHRC